MAKNRKRPEEKSNPDPSKGQRSPRPSPVGEPLRSFSTGRSTALIGSIAFIIFFTVCLIIAIATYFLVKDKLLVVSILLLGLTLLPLGLYVLLHCPPSVQLYRNGISVPMDDLNRREKGSLFIPFEDIRAVGIIKNRLNRATFPLPGINVVDLDGVDKEIIYTLNIVTKEHNLIELKPDMPAITDHVRGHQILNDFLSAVPSSVERLPDRTIVTEHVWTKTK